MQNYWDFILYVPLGETEKFQGKSKWWWCLVHLETLILILIWYLDLRDASPQVWETFFSVSFSKQLLCVVLYKTICQWKIPAAWEMYEHHLGMDVEDSIGKLFGASSILWATKNAIICCHSFFSNQVFLGWGVMMMTLLALEGRISLEDLKWVVSSCFIQNLIVSCMWDQNRWLVSGFHQRIHRNCDPPLWGWSL